MKCSICSNEAQHTHHIVSKSKGGTNLPYNKTRLCGCCHHDVHKGTIIIEGNFLTSDGYQLIFHRAGEESITGSSPDVYLFG
jgi:hypothetical protein